METGQVIQSLGLHKYFLNLTNNTFFWALFFSFYIKVKFSMYLQYMRAMGWGYAIMVFVVYFIQNVAFIGQNLWLSDWTSDSVVYFNKTYPSWKRDMRVGVFGALGVAQGNWTVIVIYLFINLLFVGRYVICCTLEKHKQSAIYFFLYLHVFKVLLI